MRTTLLTLVAACGLTTATAAQPTAFTYQGRLKNGAAPASGLHDFRFTLFNAASGGVQVGTPQCVDNVPVTDGLFTTALDFGQQFVTTEARFLQIEVRADTGLSCVNAAGLVVLGPRQPLTAAPIASHARTAFSLAAADGSPANAVFVDNTGNVGIGTGAPIYPVHIASPEPALALQDSDSTTQQVGFVDYRDSGNVSRGWVGFGLAGDPDFSIINARSLGDIVLNALGGGNVGIGTAAPANSLSVAGNADVTGNVGIGTSAPAAKLDVRGNIRLGTSGQFFAPAGPENLRIIRGIIAEDGSILEGTGFSVSHPEEGRYVVGFPTPFADVPTITATADRNPFTPGGAGSEASYLVMTDFVTLSGAEFVVRNASANVWQDRAFQFIAIGPR